MNPRPELKRALEESLMEASDDLGTHCAYADLLMEEDDPRGEFIRTQLALEDPEQPASVRKKLRQREKALLRKHERLWLGELAPLLLGSHEEQRRMFAEELQERYATRLDYTTEHMEFRHGWAKGWLDRFECDSVTVEMMRKLGRHPLARLLRTLIIRNDEEAGLFQYGEGVDVPAERFQPYEVLANYPVLGNVRCFQYGREVDPNEDAYWAGTQYFRLSPIVAKMPRLEELSVFAHIYSKTEQREDWSRIFTLPTLQNLRVLRSYHSHVYPLEVLADNPALGRLTHLLCYPHSGAGTYDPGQRRITTASINRTNVQALLNSKHLKALKHLQLRCCDGGDEMVEDILKSRMLKRLKVLDLRHGTITDQGARMLSRNRYVKKLDVLDLTNNRLTRAGIQTLQPLGNLIAERQQHAPQRRDDYDDYLYNGDTE